jgi:hypothetical protein
MAYRGSLAAHRNPCRRTGAGASVELTALYRGICAGLFLVAPLWLAVAWWLA